MLIKPKPQFTLEDNSKYEYIVDAYEIKIVIDELNDNLLVTYSPEVSEWTSCTCKDYQYRKRNCKHIRAVLSLLDSNQVEYRYNEPQTETGSEQEA